jgi:hypothetical protein
MSIRPAIVAGALLTTAAATLTSIPATAAVSTAATTVEKGVVIECTGRLDGQDVYVSLYENNRYANVVQVNVGEDGGSHEVGDIVHAGRVRAAVTIAGDTARVAGTVALTGDRTHVHEEIDDAGQHIVSDGTHRALSTRLRVSFQGEKAPLTCDNAFRYRLRVTKTPSA